ncbi:hypothetical protein [Microbacterium rhizomatis]|uniref:Secreted protein n=1 Tax=Microbacterium rhizomatis TaxID=1631477 RepID=A0A5J5IZH2_9MICO|nr:hypothetical protein [Microbacterium rhizomatis]KAA9105051.1 hypothetical protein F6B43_18570 [Microbacterium rhizomatis]
MKSAKVTATLAAVVALVLSSAIGASASGSASSDAPPPEDTPDRIIYVDHPAPLPVNKRVISSNERGEAYVADNTEFPIIPAEGETVQIVYTDAVTTVFTEPSTLPVQPAVCTVSMTVDAPTKAGNRPVVFGSAMVSRECSSGRGFTLGLYGANQERGRNAIPVPNSGNWWGIGTNGNICTYGFNSDYYGVGTISPDNRSVRGVTATLPCSF